MHNHVIVFLLSYSKWYRISCRSTCCWLE